MAQLLSVPRTSLPGRILAGLQPVVAGRRAADLDRGLAGDAARVLRRTHDAPFAVLRDQGCASDDAGHRDRALLISMIDTPWAFRDLLVFSSFQLAMPSGKSKPSSAYSLFCYEQAVPRPVDRESTPGHRCACPTAAPGRPRCCWHPARTPARLTRGRPRR